MNRYGIALSAYGVAAGAAPQIFTGDATGYDYDDATTRDLLPDVNGDNRALVLHSSKAELNFDGEITSGSTNFLDLSAGGALTVSGISSGVVLARRAVERWSLMRRKTASIQATHYKDMTQASPAAAGTDLDAFTPDQSSLGIALPSGVVIYSTIGMTHASGVVHELTLTQSLQITEDDPSPVGTILGAATHGYLREIELELLGTAAPPATKSVLAITGAPAHAGGYRIEHVRKKFARLKGVMYTIRAVWIPPFA